MINTISLNQYKFRYQQTTINPLFDTVVFIGGTFQSIEAINNSAKLWPENLNSIIIELPGFGLSDHLPEEYESEFFVDCISKALKLSNIEQQKLIAYAYSYGSGPMYRYVTQNPNQFKCLIVGGTTTRFSSNVRAEVEQLIELAENNSPQFRAEFIDTFVNPDLPTKTYRKTAILLKFMLKSLTKEDLKNFAVNHKRLIREQASKSLRIDSIKVPTLAMIGELDRFASFSDLENIETNFNNFHSIKLENCDHFFSLQENNSFEYTKAFISRHQHLEITTPIPETIWKQPALNNYNNSARLNN